LGIDTSNVICCSEQILTNYILLFCLYIVENSAVSFYCYCHPHGCGMCCTLCILLCSRFCIQILLFTYLYTYRNMITVKMQCS